MRAIWVRSRALCAIVTPRTADVSVHNLSCHHTQPTGRCNVNDHSSHFCLLFSIVIIIHFTVKHAVTHSKGQGSLTYGALEALCVADRAGVQPRPQLKLAVTDFGLQPYRHTLVSPPPQSI